jgi:hypothetical protein
VKKRAIVMDLDGTLCDATDFLAYGDHAYHEAATTIAPRNAAMHTVCRTAMASGVAVLIFSGRSEVWLEASEAWIRKADVFYEMIRFRARGDWRHNPDVKRDFVREAKERYEIVAAYDDQPSCCKMFVEEGIPYVELVGVWDPRLA